MSLVTDISDITNGGGSVAFRGVPFRNAAELRRILASYHFSSAFKFIVSDIEGYADAYRTAKRTNQPGFPEGCRPVLEFSDEGALCRGHYE